MCRMLKLSRIVKVACFILLVGCSLTKSQYQKSDTEPHILMFSQYVDDFNHFHKAINELKQLTTVQSSMQNQEMYQEKLFEVRSAYKKLEFIFDYLEPNFAYLYINGGPLPKLHKEVSEIDIILPNGLQRLDELIFSNSFLENKTEVVEKIVELEQSVSFIKESHLNDTISEQNSIELLRSGIIRVFTLGLTGFDTPGSVNGIDESLVSMKSMRNAFSHYKYNLDSEQRFVFNKILSYYQTGIDHLENNRDFDSFDRLNFLKRVVDPIYKDLLIFQKAMRIDNVPLNVHAQNYNSGRIFNADFLDVGYYSQFAYNDVKNKASIELGKHFFTTPFYLEILICLVHPVIILNWDLQMVFPKA